MAVKASTDPQSTVLYQGKLHFPMGLTETEMPNSFAVGLTKQGSVVYEGLDGLLTVVVPRGLPDI